MKKIAFPLLFCFLSLVAVACNNGSTPSQAQSPEPDVGPIREYACELVNRINDFDSFANDLEATSRGDAADICRDMELGYRRLKAEDHPSELKSAWGYVLQEIRKYLDGAWDWAAVEEEGEKVERPLRRDIPGDVWDIRNDAEALSDFIDQFYGFVRDFEGRDAETLCTEIESSQSDLKKAIGSPKLEDAQNSILAALEALYEALYCEDVEETPECEITPTLVP